MHIPLVTPYISEKNSKEIFFWTILALLLFSFWRNVDYRLISGGILLFMIGIKQYILPGIKEKNAGRLLLGFILVSTGALSLLTKNILAIGPDVMILVMLIIVIVIVGFYLVMEDYLVKKTKFLVIPILLIMVIVMSFTIGPLIDAINKFGFTNFPFYLATIAFMILINFGYFIIIKDIFSLYGIKNNAISVGTAISIFVIIGGYSYLGIVPESQKLDRFFIIISIGFVTVWGAIASFMNILDKSNNK